MTTKERHDSVETLLALAEVRDFCRSGRAAQIRRLSDVSQAEVAAYCGVTAGAVQRWETGARMPHGEAGLRYARALQRLSHVITKSSEEGGSR
jgi:DNA-binding transcriptional regulator YiaG